MRPAKLPISATCQPAAVNWAAADSASRGCRELFSTVSGTCGTGAGLGGGTVGGGVRPLGLADPPLVGTVVGAAVAVGPVEGVAGALAVVVVIAPGGCRPPLGGLPRSVTSPMTRSATPATARTAPARRGPRGPLGPDRSRPAAPSPGVFAPASPDTTAAVVSPSGSLSSNTYRVTAALRPRYGVR